MGRLRWLGYVDQGHQRCRDRLLDRSRAGTVRKIPRTGGTPADVITGLVEPNGVFSGPATRCVAPVTSAKASSAALALQGSTVLWSEGASIMKAKP